MASANLTLFNQIAVAVGGEGGHEFNIDALNEIAAELIGSPQSFTYNIDALNAIAENVSGEPQSFTLIIDALNFISGELGADGDVDETTPEALAEWLGESLHADAITATEDYQSRITSAGGTISDESIVSIKASLSALMNADAGLWAKIKEMWVPAGNSLAAALVKLKTPGASALTNSNFVSGDYTETTALYPGASNATKYLQSDFAPTSNGVSASSAAFGVYCLSRTWTFAALGASNLTYYAGFAGAPLLAGVQPTGEAGYRLKTVSSLSGTVTSYNQGVVRGTAAASTTEPSGTLRVFRANNFYNDARVGGYFAATGLTQAEIAILARFFDSVSVGLGRTINATTATFFGDSITQGVGASSDANRWATLAAGELGLTEINSGIGGTVLQNTAPTQPNNGQNRYTTAVLNKFSKRVFVLYGTNDIRYNDAAWTPAAFEASLTAVIQGLIDAGYRPKNITLGSPPWFDHSYNASTGTSPWNGASESRAEAHRDAVASVAAALGCAYRDVYGATKDAGLSLLDPDRLHPNDAGHLVIKNTMLA